jgi:tRNA A-37 threonylcarbamoyl transferase component Bud32
VYSQAELKKVQAVIAGKYTITPPQANKLITLFNEGKVPRHTGHFLPLLESDPDLFRKISADERAKRYAHFGFFPASYKLVYESEHPPEISIAGRNRGTVVIFESSPSKIVIKPVQSGREWQIAIEAGQLDVGPKQFETLETFITEEFVEGKTLASCKAGELAKDQIYTLGRRIGEIFSKLHSTDIYYNDTILLDDFSHSHIMVPSEKPAMLFDFGVAMKLTNYPHLNDEEILDYARTLPGVGAFVSMALNDDASKRETIEEYRRELANTPKERVFQRDLEFINIGLYFVSRQIEGDWDAFNAGFRETYAKN